MNRYQPHYPPYGPNPPNYGPNPPNYGPNPNNYSPNPPNYGPNPPNYGQQQHHAPPPAFHHPQQPPPPPLLVAAYAEAMRTRELLDDLLLLHGSSTSELYDLEQLLLDSGVSVLRGSVVRVLVAGQYSLALIKGSHMSERHGLVLDLSNECAADFDSLSRSPPEPHEINAWIRGDCGRPTTRDVANARMGRRALGQAVLYMRDPRVVQSHLANVPVW